MRRRGFWLGAAALAAVAVLVPAAAHADPSFYSPTEPGLFGIATAPGGRLYVADAGTGIVDADSGAVIASLPGINDVAPIGAGEMLAAATAERAGVYRVSRGRASLFADTGAFEATVDPAGDGTEEGSNPFDLARLGGHKTLVADAAGNSLLYVNEQGKIDWVASFPEQDGIQSVPTSVVVGPDGAYYVGELTGAPFPTGLSRIWRVAPGTRHAACGTSPACSIVASGLTAIIDLQFGPDGRLYVAQIEDEGVGALEGGGGSGGSVHACEVTTGACQTVVSGIPILTSIEFRGNALWGAIWALVPGLADVVPLTP
jgi:DNA-binding beta-propeller fold protein YncE